MALSEAAAYYKSKGMNLWDAMVAMYEKYGYYKDDIQSISLSGIEGQQKIQQMLETLRQEPPKEIGGYKILSAREYKKDTIVDIATGEVRPTGLPNSNVLYYDMEDDAWLCVRPSGTEPKIKFYFEIPVPTQIGKPFTGADYERCTAEAEARVPAIKASLGL
jgi:phosphoglucomutase